MIIQLGTSKGYPVLWDGKNIVVRFEPPYDKIEGFRVGVRYKYRPAIKYCYAHLNDFKESINNDTIYVYMENGTIKRCLSRAVKYFTIEYSTGQRYTCYPDYE